jgi:predicted transcriptional regulator
MTKKNRLISDFYELTVNDLMDKRVWDIPLIEEKDDIHHVLSILGGRNHIWVVKDKTTRMLTGVITEHDVLSILAPKNLPSYVFGMPDVRSLQHGTAKTASDVMCRKIIECNAEEKILDALMRMVKHRLRRLPVIKDQKIMGELTLHHLIRKYYGATQYHPLIDEDYEDSNVTQEGD